jgi:3-(3-hydroxy-phenyl)propionate hydroxylase
LVIPSRIASPYKTGEMFPQPTLFDESDCSIKLDHLIGDGFALIQCGRSDINDLGRLRHTLWDTLNAKRILIEPAGEQVAVETTCSSMRTLKDKQSTLPSAFFESQAILLLRPDRYIAAIFDCHDEEHVVQALESLFQTKHSIPLTGFTMAAEALR